MERDAPSRHGPSEATSVERHALSPVRDVRLEAERLHLRLDRELGLRVTMDQEHAAREAGRARSLPLAEVGQPGEQLALVGVGGEAADRADATANLALLA